MAKWHKTGLLYHTVKYLKLSQIYYQFYYRMRSKWRSCCGFDYKRRQKQSLPASLKLAQMIPARKSWQGGLKFAFINQVQNFQQTIDWNHDQHGKLWTYNLNYFDFLNQSDMPAQEGLRLMHDFVDQIEHVKDGLEPYPISLRGINWIKFLSRHQIRDQRLSDSLYAQYDVLLDNLEYHILGNHLLENGFSLFFGGCYFQDGKLFNKGLSILTKEINEQILPDGGHFELSPMYHAIILERMLDVFNLCKHQDYYFPWSKQLNKMLLWLQIMLRPDGTLPHFNDCAQGIAAEAEKIFAYACRLGLEVSGFWGDEATVAGSVVALDSRLRGNDGVGCESDGAGCDSHGIELEGGGSGCQEGGRKKLGSKDVSNNDQACYDGGFFAAQAKGVIHLPDSGYVKLIEDQAELICDVGRIGPDYIPGHAHADTLSFEFYYGGQPIFVNTGTSCYGYSERRIFERGTSAHNCLEVNGQNSSEVWSGFRVARRAYPLGLSINPDNKEVACTHDGYKRLRPSVIHNRRWQLSGNCLRMEDILNGEFGTASIYFYCHPSVSLQQQTDRCFVIENNTNVFQLVFDREVESATIQTSYYAKSFGQLECSKVLKLDSSANLIAAQLKWSGMK